MEDEVKEDIQQPLRSLIEIMLSLIAYQYPHVKRVGFDRINVNLAHSHRLCTLLAKTSTEDSAQSLKKDMSIAKANLANFTKAIEKAEAAREAERLKNEKEKEKLIEAEEKYDKIFPALCSAFQQKHRVEHTAKKLSTLVPRPAPLSAPEIMSVAAKPKHVTVTVARKSYEFFSEHPVEHCLLFINQVEPHEKAEAMFCIGDQYLAKFRYDEALSWLENAMNTASLQPEPNVPLMKGILLSLSLCKTELEAALAFVESQYQRAMKSRHDFIYQLGVESCTREFGSVNNLASDDIMNRGFDIFIQLGRKTQGNSVETQQRQALAHQKYCLEQAMIASNKLSLRARDLSQQTHPNFPPLATNPAGFYQQSTESQNAPKDCNASFNVNNRS